MQAWDRGAHGWAILGIAVFVLVGLVFLAAQAEPVAWLMFAAAPVWYWIQMRRSLARRRIVREPFPLAWRAVLEKRVGFYRRLAPDGRTAFERDVLIFIRENRFAAVDGIEVTDELKVLAAASAVMLLFGRTEREYPYIAEILFYPRPFDDEFRTQGVGRDISGMVHPYGTVILSAPDLRRGFASDTDGDNVGLHEFAHALDAASDQHDGVPLDMHPRLIGPWCQRMRVEMERVRRGESVLRSYAGTNEVEFFAVAVETYFEQPERLKKSSPELYAVLAQYFGERSK